MYKKDSRCFLEVNKLEVKTDGVNGGSLGSESEEGEFGSGFKLKTLIQRLLITGSTME